VVVADEYGLSGFGELAFDLAVRSEVRREISQSVSSVARSLNAAV
jgi:hypothetical protein